MNWNLLAYRWPGWDNKWRITNAPNTVNPACGSNKEASIRAEPCMINVNATGLWRTAGSKTFFFRWMSKMINRGRRTKISPFVPPEDPGRGGIRFMPFTCENLGLPFKYLISMSSSFFKGLPQLATLQKIFLQSPSRLHCKNTERKLNRGPCIRNPRLWLRWYGFPCEWTPPACNSHCCDGPKETKNWSEEVKRRAGWIARGKMIQGLVWSEIHCRQI